MLDLSQDKVVVLGRDASGRAVAEFSGLGVNGPYSFRYYLTPCCGADATGVSYGTGVACRACYASLPEDFGGEPVGELVTVFGDGISLDAFRAGVAS
jgi:hypothetical protein